MRWVRFFLLISYFLTINLNAFSETVIQDRDSTSEFVNSTNNPFTAANDGLEGQCTWYAYGRVLELVASSQLLSSVKSDFESAFWGTTGRHATYWAEKLGIVGEGFSTVNAVLPLEKRRKGLLAIWHAGEHGHVGIVEEVGGVNKEWYILSDFNRGGNTNYRREKYKFDSSATVANAVDDYLIGTYPTFYDLAVSTITNVTPLTAIVGVAQNYTITGSNLPTNIVGNIAGTESYCTHVSGSGNQVIINCQADTVGVAQDFYLKEIRGGTSIVGAENVYINVTESGSENDDNYEENDNLVNAYSLINRENQWLSSIDGYGIASDQDWYKVDTSNGGDTLKINLTFLHANGDIDMSLYDAGGNHIVTSETSSDNESIEYPVSQSASYYIKVYNYEAKDAGNSYNLWWDNPSSIQLEDKSKFISETISDNTHYSGGASFTKTWTLRNTGTTTWDSAYCLKHESGTSMGTSTSICVSGTVSPNGTHTFSVPMTAPASQATDQTYRDTWKFYKGATALPIELGGSGDTIWAQIIVDATAVETNTIHGIDVSDDQSLINWSNVKADAIDFAYIKSTEGYFEGLSEEELIVHKGLDPLYRKNMDAALNAGVLVAPYHVVRPDINRGVTEAKKEAAFFVSFIRSYYENNALLPPAIDIENAPNVDTYCTGGLLVCYTKTTLTDWLLAFAEEVELLLGVEPIFYMNQDFTHNYVDARLASNYKLWIANPSTTRPTPSHWNDWLFWQNSWTGSVSGVSGNVDKNIFEGTQSELESYLLQVDTPPEPNPRPWDFNDDNIVDYLDLGVLADHWLLDENSPNWNPLVNLDTTADSGIQVINYLDLGVLADHWLE